MNKLLDLLKDKDKFFSKISFKVFVMQYPSPDEWKKLIDISDFIDKLLTLKISDVNFYLHIPFCDYLCKYCSFSKVLRDRKLIDLFFKKLYQEIQFRDRILNFKNLNIKTIFIGGGTPTVLEVGDIRYLIDIFNEFGIKSKGEFTLETNPERINKTNFVLWKKLGVNRISIGIQTFNKKILTLYGRRFVSFEYLREKIKILRNLGFNNINFDFIYGFKGQTLQTLRLDLEYLLKLLPPHVSFYPLILYNRHLDTKELIEFFKRLEEMYEYISNFLKGVYDFYTLEYAVLKNDVAKKHLYQINYLSGDNILGFGPSSFSFLGRIWFKNKFLLNQRLNSNFFVDLVYFVNKERINLERRFILGLRLNRLDLFLVEELIHFYPVIKDFIRYFFEKKGKRFCLKKTFIKYQNLLIYYFYYLFRGI